jgi:alanyl aminopeptidase
MVRQPVGSLSDFANAFGQITYQKGAALLRMFESYIGPEQFRERIRWYLTRYAWKNATSAEFLRVMAAGDPAVVQAFSSFLDQPGVPLVSVGLKCGGGPPKLQLSQERFLSLGSTDATGHLWRIPVCVRYPAGASKVQQQCTLLDRPSSEIPLRHANGCPAWLEANSSAAGYYRVLYQDGLLDALLNDQARPLSISEKLALVGDLSALTRNGKIKLGKALALVPALARDSNGNVVLKTLQISTGLEDHLVTPELLPAYRRYLEDLYGARAHQLGWKPRTGESDDDRMLRPAFFARQVPQPSVLEVVADEAEDAELIGEAKSLALAWLADRRALDPEMVGTVIETAAQHGDRALFDRLRQAAKEEKNGRIQENLVCTLGLFPQPDTAKEAFSIALTNEFGGRSFLPLLIASRYPDTRDLAYDFVKRNWDGIRALLPSIANGFCDAQHRQDAATFFTGRAANYPGGARILAQTLEQIDLCIAYKQAQQPSVSEFLQQYGKLH